MKRPNLSYKPENMLDAEAYIASLVSYIRWSDANQAPLTLSAPPDKARCTEAEAIAYANELALPNPERDAMWFVSRMETTGWKIAGKAIKSWKAAMRSWSLTDIFPSQKQGYSKPSNEPYMPPDAV